MTGKIKLLKAILIMAAIGAILGHYGYNEHVYRTRTIKGEVTLDGKEVQVRCEGVGRPTVIFEPGLNESYMTFYSIQSEISKITRTFSYSRMSLNNESREKSPRSSLTQVNNLHRLLTELKIKGPYIIVAHSIGGFNARLFATAYPDEVAGIVFIDCSHENQQWNAENISEHGELNYDEILQSADQVKEANKKDALRNVPVTVLTADYKGTSFASMFKYWLNMQKSIVNLSNKSKHIIVENSTHQIQSEYPQTVIDAITEMISKQ